MILSKKYGQFKKSSFIDNTKWPQDGDVYFWVRSDIGMICHSEWADEGPNHQFRKDTGNCFRTRADARAAINEVIKFNRGKNGL